MRSIQNNRRYFTQARVPFLAAHKRSVCGIFPVRQRVQTLVVALGDDFRIIGTGERIFAVVAGNPVLHALDELLLYIFVREDVIGTYAGLPRVQVFSPYDAACRQIDIRTFIDNAGTFAAQFKAHRC